MLRLLQLVVMSWILYSVVRTLATSSLRREAYSVLPGLRPRHFLLGVPIILGTLGVATVLLQVPGFGWGWWSAIGGEGNVALGQTSAPEPGSEVSTSPVLDLVSQLAPAVMLTVLVFALPLLALLEEYAFRGGAENRTLFQNARRAVLFGLVHMVMGIPLGAALALSVGGAALTWLYLRTYRRARGRIPTEVLAPAAGGGYLPVSEDVDARKALRVLAVHEATRYHLAWNMMIVLPLALLTLASLAG